MHQRHPESRVERDARPGVHPSESRRVQVTSLRSYRFTFKIDKPLGKELKVKVYDKDLGKDDVLGELQWDLCKLKMGHGPKDIEKTVRRAASRFHATNHATPSTRAPHRRSI